MIEVTSDERKTRGMGLICAQPIALAAGARMLDVYCFTGGFAVAAAAGGPDRVLGLDRSEPALAPAALHAEAATDDLPHDLGRSAVDPLHARVAPNSHGGG